MSAIAVFNGHGTVTFSEGEVWTTVTLDLCGLKKNALHGFHVHKCGDLSNGCESMCAHFNPYGKSHGGPDSKERHVGDLGNLRTNSLGVAKYVVRDSKIKLRGTTCNIIGRGLIIHADEDDCGKGDFSDSLTTGHAGKRIACAVIGYCK